MDEYSIDPDDDAMTMNGYYTRIWADQIVDYHAVLLLQYQVVAYDTTHTDHRSDIQSEYGRPIAPRPRSFGYQHTTPICHLQGIFKVTRARDISGPIYPFSTKRISTF